MLFVMDETKTCTKCGKSFPATADFWYFSREKPVSPCKQCRKVYAAARYWADPPKAREEKRAARRRRGEELREQDRDYYTLTAERKRQIAREVRSQNRETHRASDRRRDRPTREENRRLLQEWYSQGCIVCGLVFLPGGMQAHHRDGQEKDQAASQLLNAKKGALAVELAKCDPLCATHHLMLTRAMEDDNGATYDEILAMLREQRRETLRAAGLGTVEVSER
jgi:hypothetical protein